MLITLPKNQKALFIQVADKEGKLIMMIFFFVCWWFLWMMMMMINRSLLTCNTAPATVAIRHSSHKLPFDYLPTLLLTMHAPNQTTPNNIAPSSSFTSITTSLRKEVILLLLLAYHMPNPIIRHHHHRPLWQLYHKFCRSISNKKGRWMRMKNEIK